MPRLHRPSGQARVRCDGKDLYLGPWGSAEARRRYQAFLRDWTRRRGRARAEPDTPAAAESPVTISVAILHYWQWAEQRYRHPDGTPTREAANMRLALQPLRKLFGALRPAELGPARLHAYQAQLAGSGLARHTVNARVNRVRRFMRWCVGRELAPAAVLEALRAVEPLRAGQGGRETEGRGPVERARIAATLPHLPPLLQALVRVLWYTGARVGEVARLATGDIDRSGDVWRARPARHKGSWRGQAQVILLGPEAIAAIRPWLLPEEPDTAIFSPRRVDPRTAKRTDPGGPGAVYSRPSLPQAVRRACRRAGVQPWTLAQLRHSRATELRERFGLDVAAVVLGHARPTMTAHYSKAAVEHAVAAIRQAG